MLIFWTLSMKNKPSFIAEYLLCDCIFNKTKMFYHEPEARLHKYLVFMSLVYVNCLAICALKSETWTKGKIKVMFSERKINTFQMREFIKCIHIQLLISQTLSLCLFEANNYSTIQGKRNGAIYESC